MERKKIIYQNLEEIENYINKLERENLELHTRIRYLEHQLEELKKPPYTVAYVKAIFKPNNAIVKLSTGFELFVNVLPDIFPELKEGDTVLLSKNNSTIIKILKDKEMYDLFVVEKPKVKYEDIGGLKEQIEKIREIVELPLKHPELFKRLGIEPPKGVLLYGPPGTGKTLLAKAVANEAGANFIYVVGSEFARKYVGEGAELIRKLFKIARENKPCIIFIDEIDAIGAKRLYGESGAEREASRTLNQLLAELDGFKKNEKIVVFGATNKLEVLDEALLRTGRFDRIIEVPLPDFNGRKEIFKIYLNKTSTKGEFDLNQLALETEGFSGADIETVVKEAAIKAIKNNKNYIEFNDLLDAIKELKERKRKAEKLLPFTDTKYRVSVY